MKVFHYTFDGSLCNTQAFIALTHIGAYRPSGAFDDFAYTYNLEHATIHRDAGHASLHCKAITWYPLEPSQ